MVADSNSRIAWHRAQLRKHREALRRIETAKFTVGEIADPKIVARSRKMVDELREKISQCEQVISLHDRQTRRPLATDLRTLTDSHWGTWNVHGPGPR